MLALRFDTAMAKVCYLSDTLLIDEKIMSRFPCWPGHNYLAHVNIVTRFSLQESLCLKSNELRITEFSLKIVSILIG